MGWGWGEGVGEIYPTDVVFWRKNALSLNGKFRAPQNRFSAITPAAAEQSAAPRGCSMALVGGCGEILEFHTPLKLHGEGEEALQTLWLHALN